MCLGPKRRTSSHMFQYIKVTKLKKKIIFYDKTCIKHLNMWFSFYVPLCKILGNKHKWFDLPKPTLWHIRLIFKSHFADYTISYTKGLHIKLFVYMSRSLCRHGSTTGNSKVTEKLLVDLWTNRVGAQTPVSSTLFTHNVLTGGWREMVKIQIFTAGKRITHLNKKLTQEHSVFCLLGP